MQFTKAIIVLSALAGFTVAAPAPAPVAEAAAAFSEIDERSAGVAVTFAGTNGTSYSVTAPQGWQVVRPNKNLAVSKVTISTWLSTCAIITGRGGFLIETALFGPNTITINPAQSISAVACASLQGGLSNIFH